VTAFIIADLGFGDAGKGTITDWLVRKHGAALVVRYNGGAQAGHTVVTSEGRAHTFAQFGSGTFVPGVRTHLSRFMVVHPTGLLVEAARLREIGVADAIERLSISPNARVITPFHQAAGRARELVQRHGSCGIGAGETVRDSIDHPADTITVEDLGRADLHAKLERIRERKRAERSSEDLDDPGLSSRWIEALRPFLSVRLTDDEVAIPRNGNVVFEGAHGVLLDEWRGFHPHTTWHTCTFEHALDLLRGFEDPIVRLGVLRTYATRHGPGPFPTEDPGLDVEEAHNPHGPWQGAFRRGWLDAVLARYAIAACEGVDRLAITHVDRVRPNWKLATSYENGALALGPPRSLTHARVLDGARPMYATPDDMLETIERTLEVPIAITSHGPRAEDKRERAV
jgi:adenylosuccinate synthase